MTIIKPRDIPELNFFLTSKIVEFYPNYGDTKTKLLRVNLLEDLTEDWNK